MISNIFNFEISSVNEVYPLINSINKEDFRGKAYFETSAQRANN